MKKPAETPKRLPVPSGPGGIARQYGAVDRKPAAEEPKGKRK